MKRFFIFLALVLVSQTAPAQFKSSSLDALRDREVVTEMKEQVSYLASAMLEGRAAGSEGEREAAEYIGGILESYGLDIVGGSDVESFGILRENGDTLRSHNVIGVIPGYDPELRDRYIVIGARLDNLGSSQVNVNGSSREKIYFGANGNASGLAMLMQLAKKLSINRVLLKRSVIIAAFGSSLNASAGSWYFLNRSIGEKLPIDAMINLDMVGTASGGFYAYTSSNRDLNIRIDQVSASLQPITPRIVSEEPVASDHRSFYEREIPSVLFTTGMYPEYNTERDTPSILEWEDMERELEFIYNFSLDLVNGKAPAFREDGTPEARSSSAEIVSFGDCDVKPAFLGSRDPADFLKKWVYVYLRYPREAVENGIQGKVLVDFVIDEKGKVQDVKVVKGVDELLDAEAVRVVSSSPNWKPAQVRGKKVKCQMTIYVEFKLERRNK